MNYENFKRELYEEFAARRPEFVEALELTVVQKNNQQMREGITIHYAGYENLRPTVYFEDFYGAYKGGLTVEAIADELVRTAVAEYEKLAGYGFNDIGNMDVEKLKEDLTFRLVNREWNQELMDSCACLEFQDLIAVPYIQIVRNGQTMSMQVNHDVQQKLLRMTDEELLAVAKDNLSKTDFEVIGMTEKLREMMGEDGFELPFVQEKEMMYVISNQENWYGAAGLMSQRTMEKIQDKIGEEMFFVLPSSVHESLIIVASSGRPPEELQEMVREVNETQVEPHERLSENVYFYNGQKLQICNTMHEAMKQIEEKWQQKETQEQTQTHGRRMG